MTFIDPETQYRDALENARKTFKHGDRVFVRPMKVRNGVSFGGLTGVVACLPGESPFVPDNLIGVICDDGTTHGIDPSFLELCSS